MKALKTIPIQVTNKGLPVTIPVVQSDSGRSIDFIITDMTIPAEATAVFYAFKRDKKMSLLNCTISDNTVTANLTTQTSAVSGIVKCQIRVISGDDIVTTFEFALDVQRTIFDDTAAESANEFTALVEALQKVNNLVTGVKGNSESAYRTGQVNISLANLGYSVASNLTTAESDILMAANQGPVITKMIDDAIESMKPTVMNISSWLANSTVIANTSRFAAQAAITEETVKINAVLSNPSAIAEGGTIMTIPTIYRPTYEQQMIALAGYDPITVAILPGGSVNVAKSGGIAASTWIKLAIEYFL